MRIKKFKHIAAFLVVTVISTAHAEETEVVPIKRYKISEDRQEATDLDTGLTWRRCAETYSIVNEECIDNNAGPNPDGKQCSFGTKPGTGKYVNYCVLYLGNLSPLFKRPAAIARAEQVAKDSGKAWRLPTAKELRTLKYPSDARFRPNGIGNAQFDRRTFPDTPAGKYHTSQTEEPSASSLPRLPRVVAFGTQYSVDVIQPDEAAYIRLVR